jgi:hypothetical protein
VSNINSVTMANGRNNMGQVISDEEARALGLTTVSPKPKTQGTVLSDEEANALGLNSSPGDLKPSNLLFNSEAAGNVGKLGLNLMSGIGAGVIGGGKELLDLVTGGGGADASQKFKDYVAKNTYQPKNDIGAAQTIERFSSPMNPVNWPGVVIGKAEEKIAGAGYPKTAATIEGLMGISPVIAGAMGLKKLNAPPVPTPGGVPRPSMPTSPRIATPVDAPQSVPVMRGLYNEPPAGFVPNPPRDLSSAGASFTTQAQAANVPAPVRQAIQLAEQTNSIHDVAAQRAIVAGSLPEPMYPTKGMLTGDIEQLSKEKNLRGKHPELAQRINELDGGLKRNIDLIKDEAAPDIYSVNHVENGQALIDAYAAKDHALRQDISAKYKALEQANGGQFPLDGKAFVDAADAALAINWKADYLPSEIRSRMNTIRDGGTMTFQNFENMRTNLAADARRAERAGDGNAAYAISTVRDALESLPMPEGPQYTALKDMADSARLAARSRFELIRNDPAYDAAINHKTLADKFIEKHVIKAPVQHVETMRANLPDDMTQQTIASGAINFLKSRAGIRGEGGNFTQAGYNKALEAISPKLHSLVDPKTAEHLNNLGEVARWTQEQPAGSFVNNSNTFVSAMGDKAISSLLDRVPVVGTAHQMVKAFKEHKGIQDWINQSLEPGAGIDRLR